MGCTLELRSIFDPDFHAYCCCWKLCLSFPTVSRKLHISPAQPFFLLAFTRLVILAGAAGARGLINPFLPHLLPQTASHYVLLSCRRGKQIWEIYERKLRESRPDPLALILHHRGSICDKLIDSSKKTIKPNHEEKNRLRKPKQRREQGNQIYKRYFLLALPILHQILFSSRTRNT